MFAVDDRVQLESHLLLVTTKADDPRCLGVLRWTLYVIAIWSFAWTLERAFLNVEIEPNEGWSAYFADAAMGKMPLYPSTDHDYVNPNWVRQPLSPSITDIFVK